MAVLINGSRVDEQIYEFGVSYPDGKVSVCANYDEAKAHADEWKPDTALKMRCVYYTEWMEAQ